MTATAYWPYDEVQLRLSPCRSNVVVETPWFKAEAPASRYEPRQLEALLKKFSEQNLGPADLGLINWFFQDFTSLPVCYILPTPKSTDLDRHQILDDKLHDLSMEELCATLLKDAKDEVSAADLATMMQRIGRRDWSWDCEAAFEFANANGKIHPESFFSVVRRYHLLEVLETNHGKEAFAKIAGLTGESFRKAAGLMVRQNHFVTQQCQDALAPAAKLAQSARDAVTEFMKEEMGHDQILGVALKQLSEAEALPTVTAQTKFLMHLLRFAAQRNFLAFALIVDGFERSSYTEVDPLAQLLENGGYSKAAGQINRHMQINDAGSHENIALGFLKSMAPCDHNYAREALHLAELTTLVMNSVPSAALDTYQAEQAATR